MYRSDPPDLRFEISNLGLNPSSNGCTVLTANYKNKYNRKVSLNPSSNGCTVLTRVKYQGRSLRIKVLILLLMDVLF